MRSAMMFAILILCSCGPSLQSGNDPGVTLRVEPQSVEAGDSVTLILQNGSADDIGYNLCSSSLEEFVSGTWQAVPSNRVCTLELRTLTPGAEAQISLEIPADTDPGEYRYVTTIEMLGAGQRGPVRSGTFRVTA